MQLRTTNTDEISKQQGSKYLSGNNLSQIPLIHCKLFPDRYSHPALYLLQKRAHAIYRDFFRRKIENFIGGKKMIFFIFSLKTYIVGTR